MEELRRIVIDENETLTDFIDTLENLKKLEIICNKPILNEDFKDVIEELKLSWMILKNKFGITVPNKIHILIDHLPVYLEKFSKTLYNLSDQTIESTHQEFAKRMEAGQYNIKNYRSVIHGKKLLRGVIHFNSLNFGYGV